jgi:hypothetical protein
MKKILWLILLLLLILLLILLYRCNRESDVRLSLGPVGYSVWGDGSLFV